MIMGGMLDGRWPESMKEPWSPSSRNTVIGAVTLRSASSWGVYSNKNVRFTTPTIRRASSRSRCSNRPQTKSMNVSSSCVAARHSSIVGWSRFPANTEHRIETKVVSAKLTTVPADASARVFTGGLPGAMRTTSSTSSPVRSSWHATSNATRAPPPDKPPGPLQLAFPPKRDPGPEGVPPQRVRADRLDLPDEFNVPGDHLIERRVRDFARVDAVRLDAEERPVRRQPARQQPEAHRVAAKPRPAKARPATIFAAQSHQPGQRGRRFAVNTSGQLGDRWRLEQHLERQGATHLSVDPADQVDRS